MARANTTHGQSRTRLHRIWKGMKGRCLSVTHPNFPRYGARGITVCDEWLEFAAFARWARAKGYTDNLTIERTDNDAGYCPANCVWAPQAAQTRNRRGVEMAPDGRRWVAVARDNGVSREAFYARRRAGLSNQDAAAP